MNTRKCQRKQKTFQKTNTVQAVNNVMSFSQLAHLKKEAY